MTELEQNIAHFFGVEKSTLSAIAERFAEEEISKGTFYTKQEGYCNKLSFIKSGYMRMYTHSGEKEITQWVSSPGYFVTELSSLLFQQRSRWNIQAITDCTVYTIYGEDYYNLKNSISEWHEIEKLFIAKCFTILEERVFSFLSSTAEERYLMLNKNHPDLVNHVPQHYLASMIGMTPETFSRLRKRTL